MADFRTVLPLLLLGLIEVKAANNHELTYINDLTSAVTYFSEETNETNSFEVTAAEPQPHKTTTSGEPDHLNLETDRQTTENSTDAFKTNGAVRAKRGIPELLENVMTAIVNEAIKKGVSAILKKNNVPTSENNQ